MSSTIEDGQLQSFLANHIKDRAHQLLKTINWSSYKREWSKGSFFYLAGNSLNPGTPNDFDIFPIPDPENPTEWFDALGTIGTAIPWNAEKYEIISNTKNAVTLEILNKKEEKIILQFCNYKYETLEELVQSFDFAHIQVGVLCQVEGNHAWPKEAYYTDDYVFARTTQTTRFTGSEYPLSSLLRMLKYHKRGDMGESQAISIMIDIVGAIVKRGFKHYEDFKDQLDAVDLGMVPEEFPEGDVLKEIFDGLLKDEGGLTIVNKGLSNEKINEINETIGNIALSVSPSHQIDQLKKVEEE